MKITTLILSHIIVIVHVRLQTKSIFENIFYEVTFFI